MIKATVKQYGNRFEVIGLDPIRTKDGSEKYEIKYLYSFDGRSYKTEKNAINAILKKGLEYIKVNDDQLTIAYD